MAETAFNLDGYLNRIGYSGARESSLPVLRETTRQAAMTTHAVPGTGTARGPRASSLMPVSDQPGKTRAS